MAELQERLQTALGPAYTIERELGGGGMSRVFLATERELGRKVVVKVLPPEMAAGVNADRFRREIQLAASLQHPHIVPLLTAGRRDDLVWYTMPLIEGESLRAKLAREGELPIGEAVRLLRDVVDALNYAHRHGVVHRDIKPDNVLISDHHGVVTDFGVAKAISEATGESSLTSVGVALGTPAYMAPEQAAADPHADHRVDIYAVGALGYETLTGRPPFTGATPQHVLAAHVTETPEPVTKRRSTVPPGLAALIMRCLEKSPADRWQTAEELLHQLEAMATPSGGMAPTAAVPAVARRRRVPLIAGGVVLAIAAVVGIALSRGGGRAGSTPLDPNVIAVLPFRVVGADPALGYLREGMIDLLAAKLTGEGGPRAADPRTVTSAFRRAVPSPDTDMDEAGALTLARGIGAGELLLGGIVGSPNHVTLSAKVLAVPGGATRAQASVEGPADSLPALLNALVAELLVRSAGAGEREATLTTTSLAALRAYLDGQAAYRLGNYDDAAKHLSRAVQLDSTFALAALSLVQTLGWNPTPAGVGRRRAERLAWGSRERLSARDQQLLTAQLGPRYPAESPVRERVEARERAVQVAPDQPEAWYLLGDEYFHRGHLVGYADAEARAAAAFRKALTLDSSFAGPLSHSAELAALRGDTVEAHRLYDLYRRRDPRGRYPTTVQWTVGAALGDSTMRRAALARLDSNPNAGIAWRAQSLGIGLDDVDRVLDAAARGATTDDDRQFIWFVRALLLWNRGRPRDAEAAVASLRDGAEFLRILGALYWDGDSTAGAAAARRLAIDADAPEEQTYPKRAGQLDASCLVGQWRTTHGDLAAAARTVARLRRAALPRDSAWVVANAEVCATMLEAMIAMAEKRPDAPVRVARFDSLMATGPARAGTAENLVAARLLEGINQPEQALAAVRRFDADSRQWLLSSTLREEGRLAALTGDRAGAIKAYQHYLALRTNPEPSLAEVVAQVKVELAKLVGEGR